MKIVKTCLPGSKLFEQYPEWLYKVIKQVEKETTYGGLCAVHKARYDDLVCYFLECDETQTRAIVSNLFDKDGVACTRIHFMRRASPDVGSAQRPAMKFYADRHQGFIFEAQTPEQLALIATALSLQFSEPSVYPLSEQLKMRVSNISPRAIPYTSNRATFAGKIMEHAFNGHLVQLTVAAQDARGKGHMWKQTFPIKSLGGAAVRNGHWLIYDPIGRSYITSTKELARFFRFIDSDNELASKAA